MTNPLNSLAILCITIYQKTLSPDKWLLSPWLKGKVCSHEPHCSEYSKQCFQRYWFFQALTYSVDRVMTCTPSDTIKHDPSEYRVVFASGAPIGTSFLDELDQDKRFDLVWVVTMPDAASDRGMKIKPNIIKQQALKLWVALEDIQTPLSLKLNSKKYSSQAQEFEQRLDEKEVDFLVVVAYGKIIPKHILKLPHIWAVNVHGSLLPKYRGASPLQSVFLDGQTESGVTVMLMDVWLDTWDMLSKLKTKLSIEWTVKDLINWIQDNSPSHLLDTLRDYAKWDITAQTQDDAFASHCAKIEKKDGLVEPFNESLISIYKKYQWYALWPKIYFVYNDNNRAIIESLEIDKNILSEREDKSLFWLFGEPIHTQRPLTNINPAIKNITIKPEGKKAMSRDEFNTNFLTKS